MHARSSETNASGGDLLTVSQLTTIIKYAVENVSPSGWVMGEVTDLARPRSGHVYLTLKDDQAQIRAVIWRSTAAKLPFDLEDGQQVICRGDLDVYPPRGSYQLVIRRLELHGLGAMQAALRKLQMRLTAEGLFAAEHKQRLPRFPRRIALITSPTGAAVRDFLEVVRRRWRGVEVLVVPVPVQGPAAGVEIAETVDWLNTLEPGFDVLVVTRGGGSMEDLWCFNDETLVRSIFASTTPVVSAIGHEIDVTLCDLVADLRALTPTEAAERVVPSREDLRDLVNTYRRRLDGSLRNQASSARARLDAVATRRVLRHPEDLLQQIGRRLDELQLRSARAVARSVESARHQVASRANQLHALSPLVVLGRGYSLTQRRHNGQLIRDARELAVGEQIITRYARGETISKIDSIRIPTEGE
jgi:exodeoxyribonuclease VII large subunit